MSAVVISGDTSGSITLQAPAVAGATTLILPASSGTSGQVLTSAGSGATMTWGSAGSYTFISTTTASASASVDIPITGSYKAYQLVCYNVKPVNNSAQLIINYTLNSFSTASQFSGRAFYNSTTRTTDTANSYLGFYVDNTIVPLSGVVTFTDLANASTTVKSYVSTVFYYYNDGGASGYCNGVGGGSTNLTGVGAINGIRISTSGGNISTGTFQLYGLS
jgi:hypothetical protein